MTIEPERLPEMLMAYADGALGPTDAARVEAAIAADPALAVEVAAHHALRATLVEHYDPVSSLPIPERLSAAVQSSPNVVDLNAVRVARAAAEKAKKAKGPFSGAPSRWLVGGAVAAALIGGMMLGSQLPDRNLIGSQFGKLMAQGSLDHALTTQRADARGDGSARILLSFKASDGHFCRAFATKPLSGIACRADGNWTIIRTQAHGIGERIDQGRGDASSADILADARELAVGGTFDPAAERAAIAAGWR